MELNKEYWDKRYEQADTGWDIGYASTPIKTYIEQLHDKDLRILVPGGGNSYEAECLLEHGFRDITVVDISAVVCERLQERLASFNDRLHIVCADFFTLEDRYDLIIEQTFFCALDPSLRKAYVAKMFDLLKPGGKLVGVLFNRDFDGGPPFGGSNDEYKELFSPFFQLTKLEACHNSITKREGSESFIRFIKA